MSLFPAYVQSEFLHTAGRIIIGITYNRIFCTFVIKVSHENVTPNAKYGAIADESVTWNIFIGNS